MPKAITNITITAVALFLIFLSGQVFTAGTESSGITADEALTRLMAGNGRFVDGKQQAQNLGADKRGELAKGQQPFAIIVSCSDSRVPPELIFDQGLGDIFIIRVAGNVADKIELGSIEYAAEHLGSPLIMVLGHSKCGAVTASLPDEKPEGNIGAIVAMIKPAVDRAREKTADKDALLDAAIRENALGTARSLTVNSPVLKHLVEAGKVKIVAAVYDLGTGKVELLAE